MNWILWEDPGTPLTADGEVHTNEEAQVYVHDQNLFVTVQLIERHACCPVAWKTLRRPRIVLWAGQLSKTTVEQRGEDNCMQNEPLPTSCCSRVIHQFWEQFVVNIDIAGSSSTRVLRITLRKTQNNNKKRNGSRDADDRFRDLPEWLEELKDDLEDTEMPAPARSSQDSDSELPTKVVSKSRKHSIFLTSQKTEIAKSVCESKWQGSLQKTHWRSSTSSKKVWWLDNGGSQSPQWGMWIKRQSPVRCRGTKILPLSGFSPIRVKQGLHKRRKNSLLKFLEPSHKPKVIYTNNPLEIGESVWRFVMESPHFNIFWSSGWISSDFSTRSIKTSSIWQESLTWDLSCVWVDRGKNLERRH